MLKSDFHFDLPPDLIAQTPLDSRDSSRLLYMHRDTGLLEHKHFFDLPELLRPGDCLVLNDSRVLPARLIGRRSTGGAIEVLLLREHSGTGGRFSCPAPEGTGGRFSCPAPDSCLWECLVRPGRKIKPGAKLVFGDGKLTAAVIDELQDGNRLVEFQFEGVFLEVLDKLGEMPLPPYIRESLSDPERYQTVYSKTPGSAAAPTAGLHFTGGLLDKLTAAGVSTCCITLHVGLGTFRPVKTDDIKDHTMHSEIYTVSEQSADMINRTKASGGRIIAVGTTSCRTLESIADESGRVTPVSGQTDIFIYPGYKFKCIDGLITNFHLPESTLIMLVSAFAGRERVLCAYEEAIDNKYRFFSFGDAMLIL